MKSTWLVYLFLHLCIHVNGQEPATYISTKDAHVGEIVILQYEIKLENKQNFSFNPPSVSFPCKRISEQSNLKGSDFTELEIIEYNDTIIQHGQQRTWRGQFKLIPWDSGTLVLQALPYIIDAQQAYFTSVIIESKLVDAKKGVRLYDIKEGFNPIDKEFILSEFIADYFWIPLVVLVLVLGLLYYKRLKKNQALPILPLSLKQQTILSIEKLANKNQWTKDQKLHYTELSFILRWYLSSRYEINLLERTSGETILLLQAMKVDIYQIQLIQTLLSEADAVKFAQSSLTDSKHFELIDQLKEIVIISSPIDLDDV